MSDDRRGVSGSGAGYQIIVRPEGFATAAAAFLGRKLGAAAPDETVSVALSGGTTPGPVYEALARSPQPRWERIDVWFADERAVAPDDPESNYRLVRETLLDRVPISPHRVHRMPADRDDLAEAARSYEREFPARLDVLVLGLGTDGHTASLFPGDAAVDEWERRIVAVDAPVEPRRRLTITPRVISEARLVVVLARGDYKITAVRRALSSSRAPSECPGRLARRGVWILDTEAVGGLVHPVRVPASAGVPPMDGRA